MNFLADEYSIADIATWPWVYIHNWSGVDIEDLPNLKRWVEKIAKRPAVERGKNVPKSREISVDEEEAKRRGARTLV